MKLSPKDLEISTDIERRVGGQHVGLTSSAITTQIGVVCNSERSQHSNKEKALAMLEILVELEMGED
jgi:peptide chain release factor 2